MELSDKQRHLLKKYIIKNKFTFNEEVLSINFYNNTYYSVMLNNNVGFYYNTAGFYVRFSKFTKFEDLIQEINKTLEKYFYGKLFKNTFDS